MRPRRVGLERSDEATGAWGRWPNAGTKPLDEVIPHSDPHPNPPPQGGRGPEASLPTGGDRAVSAFLPTAEGGGRGQEAPVGHDTAPDFEAHAPGYRAKRRGYREELDRLRDEMAAQQRRGRKVPCTRQVLLEAHWLVGYTADFGRI